MTRICTEMTNRFRRYIWPVYRSGVFVCALLMAAAGGQAASSHVLENDRVRIAWNDNGAVTELVDKVSAPAHNLIARPLPGFWKLVFHRGVSYENVVEPQFQQYRFEKAGDRLKITVDKLRFGEETLDITLAFEVQLNGDETRWTAQVVNRAPVTIVDFFYPQIGGVDSLGDPALRDDLIWPRSGGVRYRNLKASLRLNIDEPVSASQNPRIEDTYPADASMDWFEFTNGKRGIYFGSYDSPRFQTGVLQVMRLYQFGGVFQFSFGKMLFLRQGQTWTSGDYAVSPHGGDWHTGADKYRQWAATWYRLQPRPEWVDKMKGMFLVIMRQQYGDVMWTYRDLPFLYEEARKAGLDTLGLFGWTAFGHDNQYPNYIPDPAMGGEEALREGLAAVAKAGGRTILYINGHMMDANSQFAREHGGDIAAKTIWGNPYYEQYNKSAESSFLRSFSHKLFVPVCPGEPTWQEEMVAVGKRLLSYGSTGVIYDQVGGLSPYPCIQNGRNAPETEVFSAGRRQFLTGIRANLKPEYPNFGLMIEHFTDVYSQFADVLHGCGPGFRFDDQAFPQMTRYTFPGVVRTARNPEPRSDRKQANFAMAYGFRFELEVRYRSDMEMIRRQEHTGLRDYNRKISDLRERYRDLLWTGTFLDDRGIENHNLSITATNFEWNGRRAIVIWNNTKETQAIRIDCPGKRFVEAAGVDGPFAKRPESLQPQEIAVLIFE